MRVSCPMCQAEYERSTFRGVTKERGSFECYGCGNELERWDTDLVPTYRIAVVEGAGLPLPDCILRHARVIPN
jgi:hypothetical protein